MTNKAVPPFSGRNGRNRQIKQRSLYIEESEHISDSCNNLYSGPFIYPKPDTLFLEAHSNDYLPTTPKSQPEILMSKRRRSISKSRWRPIHENENSLHLRMKMSNREKHIEVSCYSGYKANERPLSFVLGERKFQVKRIVERWFGQDYDYFKVFADDGGVYTLKWHRRRDRWSLVQKA
jgi:hypothetical protein